MRRYGRWEIRVWFRADGRERPHRTRSVRCHICGGRGWVRVSERGHVQCEECEGYGGWTSNLEVVPGSRWRKTNRAEEAVRRYSAPGGLGKMTMFTDPALERS